MYTKQWSATGDSPNTVNANSALLSLTSLSFSALYTLWNPMSAILKTEEANMTPDVHENKSGSPAGLATDSDARSRDVLTQLTDLDVSQPSGYKQCCTSLNNSPYFRTAFNAFWTRSSKICKQPRSWYNPPWQYWIQLLTKDAQQPCRMPCFSWKNAQLLKRNMENKWWSWRSQWQSLSIKHIHDQGMHRKAKLYAVYQLIYVLHDVGHTGMHGLHSLKCMKQLENSVSALLQTSQK